jgi:hypothetical protein
MSAFGNTQEGDSSKDITTVISFKDKSTGALSIIKRDTKIIAIKLHDVTKGELYRADIDEYGRGKFTKQDINQYICTDYAAPPNNTIEEIRARLPPVSE